MIASEKLAATLIASAMHKRTLSQILWEQSNEDLAKAKQILEEVSRNAEKHADRPDRPEV